MKKNKMTIVVLVIALLATLLSFGYYVWQNNNSDRYSEELKAQKGNLPGKTKEEIQALMNQKVSEGMVNVGINTRVEFENGKSIGNVSIENIDGNHYGFKVDIYLEGEKKKIADTKVIKPGYYLSGIKLNKNLKKGEYPAKAIFTIYYPDSKDVYGKTEVLITLVIKK